MDSSCYPQAVSETPPDDSRDPSRRARVISDPNLDDGLSLTGPGAPTKTRRSFQATATEHPVRARLLERASLAGGAQPQSFSAKTTPPPALAQPFTKTGAPPILHESPRPLPVGPLDLNALSETTEPIEPVEPVEPVEPEPSAEFEELPAESPPPPVEPSAEIPPGMPPAPAAPEPEKITAPMLTPAPADVMIELDRIARRSNAQIAGPSLSPNLTALLGGLLGLTVIVTLGLLLGKSQGSPAAATTKPEVVAAPTPAAAPEVPAPTRLKVKGPWRVMDAANDAGHRVMGGKIGKQAFLRAIQDAGLPKSEAYRVYAALKDLLNLDHCKSSDEFLALVSGREKKLVGFEYIINKEEVYQVKANPTGLLAGAKLDLQVSRNQIRRAFAHDGKSFEDSARRAGFDPGIAETISGALRGHSALADFKAGDRMRIIAQEVTVLGEFSRYAGVEAMEILRPGQEPRRIYYYAHPVEGGHFDTTGRAPYEGGWRKPIPGAPRTSPFNMKRMHPVLNKVMPHTGTDFGAPMGTPIGATSPGVVSFIGPAGPSGNLVKVKHEGGYESGYAHLSRFAEGLAVGARVDRLQLVGYCGSTGRSTGPHLHFTMKKDDVFIDPESLNLDGMRVLAKSHREAFAEVRAKYDPILDAVPLPDPIVESAPPSPEVPQAGDEEMGAEEEAMPQTKAATPPGAPAQPAATPAPQAPSVPTRPAQAVAPSSIFLTNEELLRLQSASDEGEVAQ